MSTLEQTVARDLAASRSVPVREQASAVLAEIMVLEALLPRLVRQGKETQSKADRRLGRLRAALGTLRTLEYELTRAAAE